ncbi:hypothetical protein G7199_000001 [Salmonella enterica]|nr:hypothetical protein [Salmonella enterica]EHG6566030.1 hypothetical protein [Salmonella enterica subsp. salamae serovar 58:l,z13,z28:z6]
MSRGSDRFSPQLSGGVPTLTVISSPVDADAGGLALETVVDGGDRDIPQGDVSLSVGARYFLALL